jgi:hypothetical protein
MSHVVTIQTEIKSLEALQRACQRMGWLLKPDQKTFAWYGRWVKDYHEADAAYRNGIKPEDYGKCDMAIEVPGAKYEIGLLEREGKFIPVWDGWGPGGLEHLSQEGMGGFLQAYATEAARLEAIRQGFTVTESAQDDGSILLTCCEGY